MEHLKGNILLVKKNIRLRNWREKYLQKLMRLIFTIFAFKNNLFFSSQEQDTKCYLVGRTGRRRRSCRPRWRARTGSAGAAAGWSRRTCTRWRSAAVPAVSPSPENVNNFSFETFQECWLVSNTWTYTESCINIVHIKMKDVGQTS